MSQPTDGEIVRRYARIGMTRIAVISDVHADVHALRDALGQADRLDVGRVVCCGDIVDYGLLPEETIGLL